MISLMGLIEINPALICLWCPRRSVSSCVVLGRVRWAAGRAAEQQLAFANRCNRMGHNWMKSLCVRRSLLNTDPTGAIQSRADLSGQKIK